MQTLLAIAAGGALGSALRYLLSNFIAGAAGTAFPWGIMLINVLGSFAMGVLVAVFAQAWAPSQTMRAFLTTGILGGFTTFSTFSLDAALLFERGAPGLAVLYSGGSVVLGIGGLFAGMLLVRTFAA